MSFTSRLSILLLTAGLGFALTACDSTPETRPMDQPLDQSAAFEADQRMQERVQSLLEEQQGATERR